MTLIAPATLGIALLRTVDLGPDRMRIGSRIAGDLLIGRVLRDRGILGHRHVAVLEALQDRLDTRHEGHGDEGPGEAPKSGADEQAQDDEER